jgi:hypothetical protein
MAGGRFTAGCLFSKDRVILIHLTLSGISFVHDGALVINHGIAVVSREDLVSEVRGHICVLVTVVGLLQQPL